MVDVQTWLALVFILIMSIVIYKNRSRLTIHRLIGPLLYFVMMKTRLGLSAMNWLGTRWRTFFRWFGYASIGIGFAGMVLITYQLVKSTILLFVFPQTAPGIQPVLPFEAKGIFFVPFIYWIISIFVIAFVHEFFHGIIARAHDIKVKSSGFAFLGIVVPVIPAAFVEPDEKALQKSPASKQLSIFAAGPAANIVMALLMVFAFGIDASPAIPHEITQHTALWDITETGNSIITFSGLEINSIAEGSAAEAAGLSIGDTITAIDGVPVQEREATIEKITSFKPGQTVVLGLGDDTRTLVLGQHPQDPSRGHVGVNFDTHTAYAQPAVERYGEFGVALLHFMISVIIWIFVLSLGIGLFNLIPLGPIDGGRMLKLVLQKFTCTEIQSAHIWKWVSFVILGMILINIIIGFVR